MPDKLVEIPVPDGQLFRPEETAPVHGGGSRIVKLVPVGDGHHLPCLARSHRVVTVDSEGNQIPPSNECLLLASRDPYLTLRAYVEVAAWPSFRETSVEW